jgi:hypothetical protein
MFPRRSALIRSSIRVLHHSSSSEQTSLRFSRQHKNLTFDNPINRLHSVTHAENSTTVYPVLKLSSAWSARPKREKRRQPIFPEGGSWTDIRGDTAGDDAWVVGKYYLGMNPCWRKINVRRCGWCWSLEYKRKRTTGIMGTTSYALLGFGM